MELIITKIKAEVGVILPFGISLTSAVLSLLESISLSIYLIKCHGSTSREDHTQDNLV